MSGPIPRCWGARHGHVPLRLSHGLILLFFILFPFKELVPSTLIAGPGLQPRAGGGEFQVRESSGHPSPPPHFRPRPWQGRALSQGQSVLGTQPPRQPAASRPSLRPAARRDADDVARRKRVALAGNSEPNVPCGAGQGSECTGWVLGWTGIKGVSLRKMEYYAVGKMGDPEPHYQPRLIFRI